MMSVTILLPVTQPDRAAGRKRNSHDTGQGSSLMRMTANLSTGKMLWGQKKWRN